MTWWQRRLGWGGVAFKTISLLEIREASPRFSALSKEGRSFIGFKNIEQLSDHTYEENLDYLRRLKRDFPGKVIIASIMGRNETEWTRLAADMEAVGADMIECNFSCPQMAEEGLGAEIGENPELVARYTAAVRKGTRLPVLAKMTPNINRMEIPAKAAVAAGADGIAAINTIRSIMNIDLDRERIPHWQKSPSAVWAALKTGGMPWSFCSWVAEIFRLPRL